MIDQSTSRQVYLTSRTANTITDSTKMSQMTFCLTEPIKAPDGYDLYCSLVDAQIPNTIQTVDANTTFVLNFYSASLGYTFTETITTSPTIAGTSTNTVVQTGNYSGTTGPASLATQLSKVYSPTSVNTIYNSDYVASSASGTNILVLSLGPVLVGETITFTNAGITAAGLAVNTKYFIISQSGGSANINITVSLTSGGTVVPLTTATLGSTTGACLVNDTITTTVTYNAAQSRYQIAWTSVQSPNGANYTLTMNNIMLGVNCTSATTPVLATGIPKLFPNYLLVGTNMAVVNQSPGMSQMATIGKVVIDVPYNSWIYYSNKFLFTSKISQRELGTIEIVLYDEYGNLANLNGANWSMTLQFDTRLHAIK